MAKKKVIRVRENQTKKANVKVTIEGEATNVLAQKIENIIREDYKGKKITKGTN